MQYYYIKEFEIDWSMMRRHLNFWNLKEEDFNLEIAHLKLFSNGIIRIIKGAILYVFLASFADWILKLCIF